jgi:hypothetical protein
MADPLITIEPPRRSPRTGGLLSVAEVRDVARLAAANGVQYVADPCLFDFGDAGFCYGDLLPGDADDKVYTGIGTGASIINNFAAYYGVECFINDDGDLADRARSAFDLAESRNVEEKFAVWLNARTVDVGVAGIIDAIAGADEHADDNYIARPILHMSRDTATRAYAADALIRLEDGTLITPHGTPVDASGRYGNDVWVTGAVLVLRSPLVESAAQTLNLYIARFDWTA